MKDEDRKVLELVIPCVIFALLVGAGTGYVGAIFVSAWALAGIYTFVVYVASCILRPLVMREYRDHGGDPFREGSAQLMTMFMNGIGCLPIVLLTGLIWVGSIVGVWIGEGFLATLIVNLIWPCATVLMLIVEKCIMEFVARKRQHKNQSIQ